MITTLISNSSPYINAFGGAHKVLGKPLPNIAQRPVNEICICDYITCEYKEPVFSGDEDYKKDYSEFLFKRFLTADTVELELYKGSEKVADLDDDTLGTLYDGFGSGNEAQQLYYGFVVDWTLVQAAHGSGIYTVKANLSIVGTESEYTSRKFDLMPYSDIAANETVKIVSTQNGNIFGSEFDFTGLEWEQYLRLRGVFGNPTPSNEVSQYITSRKEIKQIKSKMSREWTLQVYDISWEVQEKLVYNKLLANQILISDYSILSENIWRNVNVVLSEIEKKPFRKSNRDGYNIKFVDNTSIFEKTNF